MKKEKQDETVEKIDNDKKENTNTKEIKNEIVDENSKTTIPIDDDMEKENETANEMKKDVEKVASDTAALNNANVSDKLRTNNSDISETENNKEFDDRLRKLIKNDAIASKKMNRRKGREPLP